MDTLAEWRARKRAEVALLARAAGEVDAVELPDDADAVHREKLRLRAALLARFAAAAVDLVETRRPDDDHQGLGPYDLSWRYQRFDLSVRGPQPYPGLMDDRASVWVTDWTSSGMGAVASVLLALPRLAVGVRLIARHDVYFETLEVARTLTPLAPHLVAPDASVADTARAARALPDDVVVWWADSFGASDPAEDPDALAVIDHLVVDTTCWAATSPRLRKLVDAALEQGVPVTLVRSHVKLDFLGVEYGRLGSMVHIATPFLPKARFDRYRALASAAARARRGVGATVTPLHLPPLQGDPVFHAVNSARVAAIARACAHVADGLTAALADGPATVRRYPHGLFVALGVFREVVGPVRVREAGEALVAALRDDGLAAAFANSFGFDFAAVAPFRHPTEGWDELRLAVPDWPTPWCDALVAAVARWARARAAPISR